LRNGIWPAWAPLGYVNDKNARCITVDKEKAKYIKRAFEMYATGEYPLAQIRKIINSLGLVGKKGKMLSVSNYQYMLKNPIYCGIIRYKGEIYDGKHKPIITKKLFDKCQEVMMKKSKPKTPKLKPYVYRGLFRCGECGCFITTETQKVRISTSKVFDKGKKEKAIKEKVRYTLEDHLGGISPKAKKIFEAINEKIVALDESIIVEPKAKYIAYKLATNFVDIVVKQYGLKIFLNVPSRELNDPNGIARDLTKPKKIGHWGNGDYEVKLEKEEEIDQVFELIKQSYTYNK
jgi:predicted transport protein